jgi:hypothetical protein
MGLVVLGPLTPVKRASFETIRLLHDEATFCRTSNRKGELMVMVVHMTSRALACMYSTRYSTQLGVNTSAAKSNPSSPI